MREEVREAWTGHTINGFVIKLILRSIQCDGLLNLLGTPFERTYKGLTLRAVLPGRGRKRIYLTTLILY